MIFARRARPAYSAKPLGDARSQRSNWLAASVVVLALALVATVFLGSSKRSVTTHEAWYETTHAQVIIN
jgi:hypothetical protein